VGIEERVAILGGAFSVSSGPESGTTIVVTIPVGGEADTDMAPDSAGARGRDLNRAAA
jgi:signal transduction histidine kinase